MLIIGLVLLLLCLLYTWPYTVYYESVSTYMYVCLYVHFYKILPEKEC